MLLEQLLDLRHVRTSVEARHDALLDDEDEGRHLFDAELLQQFRMLVGVYASDTQASALLACDVREKAFHSAGRP